MTAPNRPAVAAEMGGGLVAEPDLLATPAGRTALDLRCAYGVTEIEAVQHVIPERDAPAVRHAFRVALQHRNVGSRVAQLRQDAEVQPSWTSPDADGPHGIYPPNPVSAACAPTTRSAVPPRARARRAWSRNSQISRITKPSSSVCRPVRNPRPRA